MSCTLYLLSGLVKLSLQDGQTCVLLLGTVANLCVGPGQGSLLQPQGTHLLQQLLFSLLQQLPAVEADWGVIGKAG